MDPEQRFQDLGFSKLSAPPPVASYVPAQRAGNLLFVSGQGPVLEGKFVFTGKVGAERSEAEGVEAARLCALNALSVIRQEIGTLNAVRQVVKLVGWVACSPDFNRQPFVINGASEVIEEVFGKAGRHARSAVGTNALPFDISVEVELVVEVDPHS